MEVRGSVTVYEAAAIRLLMLTGCRKNEIVKLKWKDVDVDAGEIRIPDGKTGARLVPLSPAAAEVLSGLPRKASPHPSPIRDFEFTLLVLDADWVAIPVVGRSALRSKGVRTVPGAFVAGSPGHIDLDCELRACAGLGVAPVFGQCGTEVVKLSGLTP